MRAEGSLLLNGHRLASLCGLLLALLTLPEPSAAGPGGDAQALQAAEADARLSGVETTCSGDRLDFRVTVDGQPKALFSTALSGLDPAAVRARLQELTDGKISELEKRYQIHIARDGERTTHRYSVSTIRSSDVPITLEARTPRLNELYVLEAALQQSEPSQLLGMSPRSGGVPVYFIKDLQRIGIAAEWGLNHKEQPAVFVDPIYSASSGQTLTEPSLSGNVSRLKEILIHEFAHNAAHRLGYDIFSPEKWALIKPMGWHAVWKSDTSELLWLVQSRESPDYYYRAVPFLKRWVRCDRSGRPLTEDGSVTRHLRQAYSADSPTVARLALVPPPTGYFYNPMEEFAEALMMYRFSVARRQALRKASPDLFELIRQTDQQEIDRTFGKGRFARGLDGRLIESGARSSASRSESGQ